MKRLALCLATGSTATLLTVIFWNSLWNGGGLIGGDVYSYFLPQKVFYAEQLQAGRVPLWNPRVGYGYPLVGESQTGVFYPLNLLLYGTLSVHAAYNASHVLHYIFCFLCTFLYARRLGLSHVASGFTALSFTYSWFPVRSCWEWAIVTGSWLPACLWCQASYHATGRLRYQLGLITCLTLQLLAGHFNLAFVTWLCLLTFAVGLLCQSHRTETRQLPTRRRLLSVTVLAMLTACGLTAFQLLPTWELKQHSQRATIGVDHELEFGAIPASTLSQLGDLVHTESGWTLWSLPSTARDALLSQSGIRTNQVEAALYVGVVPLLLAVGGLFCTWRQRPRSDWLWVVSGVLATVHASGVLIPWLQPLPGFSYFQGPGRFGIVTSLAIACLAGRSLDQLRQRTTASLTVVVVVGILLSSLHQAWLLQATTDLLAATPRLNPLRAAWWPESETAAILLLSFGPLSVCGLAVVVASLGRRRSMLFIHSLAFAGICLTTVDLWNHSRLITYSPQVAEAPISQLESSPLRQLFSQSAQPTRCLSPGGNLLSIADTSTLPVYLTFGPSVYPAENRRLTGLLDDRQLSQDESDWLAAKGATHILSLHKLQPDNDLLRLSWSGHDPMFSVALGHTGAKDQLWLYELNQATGRLVARVTGPGPAASSTTITPVATEDYAPDEVTALVSVTAGAELELRDLQYPGWRVLIDGLPRAPLDDSSMFRKVTVSPGNRRVTWHYSPRSLYWGLMAAGLTATGTFFFVLRCRSSWHAFDRLGPPPSSTSPPSLPEGQLHEPQPEQRSTS